MEKKERNKRIATDLNQLTEKRKKEFEDNDKKQKENKEKMSKRIKKSNKILEFISFMFSEFSFSLLFFCRYSFLKFCNFLKIFIQTNPFYIALIFLLMFFRWKIHILKYIIILISMKSFMTF